MTEIEFYLSFLDDRMLSRLRKAWASYQKYGAEGPPVGSKVVTIRSGFGGTGDDHRTITDRDEFYFTLSGRYGSRIESWWRDFYVEEK